MIKTIKKMLKRNNPDQGHWRSINRYKVNVNISILDDIKFPAGIYDVALLQKGDEMPSEVLNYLLKNNEEYKHFFNRTSDKKTIVIDAYPKVLEGKNIIYFKMRLVHKVQVKADSKDNARLQALSNYENNDIHPSIQLIKKPGTDVDISIEFQDEYERKDRIYSHEVGY